jgi:hypothetical protein
LISESIAKVVTIAHLLTTLSLQSRLQSLSHFLSSTSTWFGNDMMSYAYWQSKSGNTTYQNTRAHIKHS